MTTVISSMCYGVGLSHVNQPLHKNVRWRAMERAVGPGFDREKCEVKLVGTYGPAIQASKGTFPEHSTPIPQLEELINNMFLFYKIKNFES
ncbi:unnamed protein product [Camellia sinensis]